MDVVYELGNLIRGQVTARITPGTWWTNMQQGWVWDLDDLTVNQIGHPYQGSNYFNTGRANGLNFYESSAITAFVGVFRRDELYIAERATRLVPSTGANRWHHCSFPWRTFFLHCAGETR